MESDNKIPEHIAIIMDGNRRWAKKRGLPTQLGHREGYERFKDIAEYCRKIGVKNLTVYAFSTENWKRSQEEVRGLMELFRFGIKAEQKRLHKDNARVKLIGRVQDLPDDIQEKIKEAEEITSKNTGIKIDFAISYGGRAEIVDAVKNIISQGKNPDEVTEELISQNLYDPEMKEPDLIIRTGGEKRLSNFLMWNSGYSELYFTDELWPDFKPDELDKAITYFNYVKRNFGE